MPYPPLRPEDAPPAWCSLAALAAYVVIAVVVMHLALPVVR